MVFCLNQNIPEVWNSVKKYKVNKDHNRGSEKFFFFFTKSHPQIYNYDESYNH